MKGGDTSAKAAANGKRVGRPPKPQQEAAPVLTKKLAAKLYADKSTERRWQELRDAVLPNGQKDMALRFRVECEIQNQATGKAMDTVNHLHDKPIEVNATLKLGEGMIKAMKDADERLSKLKR